MRAALPGWLEGGSAGSFDLALCDPPYDFSDWPALLGALRAALVVTESSSAIPRPRVGWSQERRYGGTLVTVASSEHCRLGDRRPLPRVVRPVPQRPPRDRRAGQPALRRGRRGRPAQPPEERAPLRPRRARGDARRGRGAPADVRIVSVATLFVNVARDVGASAIVRGLRAVSDFETEMQMAQMNNHLSGVETIFIPTSSKYSFVASKLVRRWPASAVTCRPSCHRWWPSTWWPSSSTRRGAGASESTSSWTSTRSSPSRRWGSNRSSTSCSTSWRRPSRCRCRPR